MGNAHVIRSNGGNKRIQKGIYQERTDFVKHQKVNMRLPGPNSLLQLFNSAPVV